MTTESNKEIPIGTIIKVVGVGGAGGNAIQHMISKGLPGVEFIVANTDAQALAKSTASKVIQLGESGLGAGMKPDLARSLAEKSYGSIAAALQGADMVFIAAGMGGGTGTGAAPIIARAAKEAGALTVAVVSKPFSYEGARCMSMAEAGLAELAENVDSLIVILNEKLEDIYEDGTMLEWFGHADDVLNNAVAGIAEIINIPGHVNVDFNDVKTIMGEQGKAMMGTATAEGDDRAKRAAEQAIASPLLDGIDLSGAKGVLVNITASRGLKGKEIKEVMRTVRAFAADDATIAQGIAYDETMGDVLRVTVVATGLGGKKQPPVLREVGQIEKVHSEKLQAPSLATPRVASTPQRAGPAAPPVTEPRSAGNVWRHGDATKAVQAMTEQGTAQYDIPAFLRKQVD
jgi:cell division protein FtsZ